MLANKKTTKKAGAFFQANHNDLQAIFTKVKLLEELNNKVIIFLDENLKNSCQVVNLTGSILTVLTSSGSVATQLRFLVPDLLRKFQSDGVLKKIQHIQCKVRPPQTPLRKKPSTEKMSLLSAETAAVIEDIASSMGDPKLKEALKKIAAHTETIRLPLK
jgi:hypothetical protein